MIAQPRLIAADVPGAWLADGSYRLGADGEPEKRCHGCGGYAPAHAAFFYARRSAEDGLDPRCRACWRGRRAEIKAERRRQFAVGLEHGTGERGGSLKGEKGGGHGEKRGEIGR